MVGCPICYSVYVPIKAYTRPLDINAPTPPPTPPFGGGEQPLILEGEKVTLVSVCEPPPTPPKRRGASKDGLWVSTPPALRVPPLRMRGTPFGYQRPYTPSDSPVWRGRATSNLRGGRKLPWTRCVNLPRPLLRGGGLRGMGFGCLRPCPSGSPSSHEGEISWLEKDFSVKWWISRFF